MALRTATLRAARMLASNVRELTLDPGEGFTFTPGQWVSLKIPRPEGDPLARSYSIASAPRADGCFDLAVTLVTGGAASAWLHAMQVGAEVPMSEAAGFFTLPEVSPRPMLMVATGTGVAPIRAMIQSLSVVGSAVPVALLFGVRTERDILYGDEFRALPWLRFEPTLSRADATWSGHRGYVQTHLAEMVGAFGGECDVYVCGLNVMITEVRRVLKRELGFTRDRVHSERYD